MITSVRHGRRRRGSHPGSLIAALLLAAAFMAARLPAAAQLSFQATHVAELTAANEVPPSGASGTGLAIFNYDPTTRQLSYRLSVTRLAAPASEARLHAGKAGATGPMLLQIPFPSGSSTVQGALTLGAEEAERLLADELYIDIFTSGGATGQIRGQVSPIYNAGAFGLSGQYEVPPVMTSSGVGEGRFWVDPTDRSARYRITWRNLTGRATAIQIGRGRPGLPGSPVATFPVTTADSSLSGVWTDIRLFDLGLIRSGGIYVNVLTDSFPEGEIRAKITQVNTFTAAIGPSNVLPPAAGPAAGTGVVRLVEEYNAGAFVNGSFVVDGFSGAVTGAHLHHGSASVNADTAILTLEERNGTVFVTPPGYLQLYGDDYMAFFQGNIYADFHTGAFPGGEARGQLVPSLANITETPAGVAPVAGEAPATLRVVMDADGASAHLLIDRTLAGLGGYVEIVSPLGARVFRLEADREHLVAPVDALAAGLYLARLVSADGITVATGRIPVRR